MTNIPNGVPAGKPPVNLTPAEDARLIQNAYEAIACVGKRPIATGWTTGKITVDRLANERALYPNAVSTGLRTGTLVGIDIDVVKWEHATKLRSVVQSILGVTPLRRKGAKGLMLIYRNETPISKIVVGSERPDEAKVEILGTGQQLIIFGIHPDTGKRYDWADGGKATPLTVPFNALPLVTPDKLRKLAVAIAAELTNMGYGTAKVTGDTGEKPATLKDRAAEPVAEKVLRDALGWRDPDAEREEWRDDVAAIHDANIPDDADCAKRRQIAHDYSEGKLDRLGRFEIETPKLYTTPEAVDTVFDTMPPKEDGITVGRIFGLARDAGWKGNSYASGETVSEMFKGHLGADHSEPNDKAGPEDPNVKRWLGYMQGTRPNEDVDLPAPEFWDDECTIQKDPDGYVVLYQGKKGSMKTYVTLGKLMKLAVEKKVMVAYFAGEGSYGVRTTRIQAIAKHLGISLDELSKYWITFSRVPDLFNAAAREAMFILLDKTKPNFVVLDTLGQASPGQAINSPEFGTALTAATAEIRFRYKCVVFLIHHMGKVEGKGALGSTMIIADPGTVGEIREVPGYPDLREMFMHHVREGEAGRGFGYRLHMSVSLKGVSAPVPVRISDTEFATLIKKAKKAKHDPMEGTYADLGVRIRSLCWQAGHRSKVQALVESKLVHLLILDDYGNAHLDNMNAQMRREVEIKEAEYKADLNKAAGRPARPGKLFQLCVIAPMANSGSDKAVRHWYCPPSQGGELLGFEDADSFRTMQ